MSSVPLLSRLSKFQELKGDDCIDVPVYPNPGYCKLRDNLRMMRPDWPSFSHPVCLYETNGGPPSTAKGALLECLTEVALMAFPKDECAKRLPQLWLAHEMTTLMFDEVLGGETAGNLYDTWTRMDLSEAECWDVAITAYNHNNVRALRESCLYALVNEGSPPVARAMTRKELKAKYGYDGEGPEADDIEEEGGDEDDEEEEKKDEGKEEKEPTVFERCKDCRLNTDRSDNALCYICYRAKEEERRENEKAAACPGCGDMTTKGKLHFRCKSCMKDCCMKCTSFCTSGRCNGLICFNCGGKYVVNGIRVCPHCMSPMRTRSSGKKKLPAVPVAVVPPPAKKKRSKPRAKKAVTVTIHRPRIDRKAKKAAHQAIKASTAAPPRKAKAKR